MSLHLQPTIFVLVISTFLATLIRAHNCSNSCGTGKYAKSVPYPFGFSPGCPIQLDCSSDTGAVKIAEFVVQNVTPNGILVDFPPKCDRPIHSIKPLFGLNYALAWQNSLLFQNCTGSLNGCVIPTSMITRRFNLQSCDSNKSNNISCVSQEDNKGINVSSYENVVNMTPCSVLFSSISFDSGYSLHFQRIELEWWLSGSCVAANDCHPSANCTNIQLSNGNGYRCRCNPGFEGDGFVTGDGCRKIVDCNPSKYMAGHCGGTTRVGALVGGIVAGAVLMALLGIACFFIRRRSNLNDQLSAKRLICEAADNSSVPFYPYKEIERATNFFSEKQMLGTGAYGTVYAGKLHDLWVAVKMFRHRDTGSIDKVMNEIKLLTSVSHPNLVRLLGCCVEEGEPILIYEFMPNGTLSQHLQRERGNGLPWSIRLIIAAETAHAIAYLHSAVNPPIYHRDIKSSNILLDFNYNSKVADFGLSRLGMTESSYISTAPQGTPGYLDPEYHQYFHLSDKSDVYSFGVVLVEIITALKVVDFSRPHSEVNLAALAVDRIGRGGVDEIIDPYLEPHRDAWTLSSIHNVAELAFRCLSYHRDMRPTMMEVAEELEHIRLCSWVPASPAMSSCSFSDHGIEMSMGGISVKSVVESGRLVLPPRATECLHSLEEVKDGSPVSVHDPWLSGQSSPSTNSLLGDRPRTVL